MRKAGRMIFLLCVALIVCMQGLCLAADGNWVRYYQDANEIYYVDTNSIKTLEYKGRKYLEVKGRTEEKRGEDYVVWAKWHLLFDVENQKVCPLKFENKKTNSIDGIDISQMHVYGNTCPTDFIAYTFQLMEWVERNYPSVIDEIRTFNRSGQSATNVTSTAGGLSSGSVQDIVGDIEYEVLDSGAVRFSPRCMAYGVLEGDSLPLYAPSYFIFAKPEKYSALPGAYLIGWLTRWMDGSWDPDDDTTISTNGVTYMREEAFDYDPKTQTFTFYAWMNRDTPEYLITYRMRFIDKNTVCIIYKSLDYQCNVNNTYRYMPYDKIPVVTSINGSYITVEDNNWYISTNYDRNKCVWFADHFPYFLDGGSNLNPVVDMARAFLAVNGKVGPIPDEYNVMTSVEGYD